MKVRGKGDRAEVFVRNRVDKENNEKKAKAKADSGYVQGHHSMRLESNATASTTDRLANTTAGVSMDLLFPVGGKVRVAITKQTGIGLGW